MSKILVTGASGDLGRKTLLHLLARRPAGDLVGLARDPAKAADLAARGIEMRKGDYLDRGSLARAFVGVDKVMLTATHAFTERNVAHANVIEEAALARIRHLVFMPIRRKTGSTFSMKEITEEDIFTVERLRASGIPYTLAEHPPFLDVLAFYIGAKAHETGVRVLPGNGKFTAASRNDLAEAHAAILAGEGHEHRTYRLTGAPPISFSDIADILTKIVGKKVPYAPISAEEFFALNRPNGIPDFVLEFALTWIKGLNAGEWDEQTGDLEKLIGRKAQTPYEFFRDEYVKGGTHLTSMQ